MLTKLAEFAIAAVFTAALATLLYFSIINEGGTKK